MAFEGSFLDALMSPFEALYTDILKKDNFRKERFITLGLRLWSRGRSLSQSLSHVSAPSVTPVGGR